MIQGYLSWPNIITQVFKKKTRKPQFSVQNWSVWLNWETGPASITLDILLQWWQWDLKKKETREARGQRRRWGCGNGAGLGLGFSSSASPSPGVLRIINQEKLAREEAEKGKGRSESLSAPRLRSVRLVSVRFSPVELWYLCLVYVCEFILLLESTSVVCQSCSNEGPQNGNLMTLNSLTFLEVRRCWWDACLNACFFLKTVL